jgi:hypothetical protein
LVVISKPIPVDFLFWKTAKTWNSEGTGHRALDDGGYTSGTLMTIESCIAFCSAKGSYYAGVEYSAECCKRLHQILCRFFESRLRISLQIVQTFFQQELCLHSSQTVQCLALEHPMSHVEALVV